MDVCLARDDAWQSNRLDVLAAAPLSESLSGPAGWMVVGVSVVLVLYLTVRPKKRDPLADQPFRASLAQQKSLERDMQNVIVELSEMTRQMASQIETRAAKLDILIQEADVRLLQLRQAIDDAGQRSIDGSVSRELPWASPSPVPVAQAMRPTRRTDDNPHGEDRWAEVYRLGEQGLSMTQIAQQLGRPTGEIELILALRPKAKPATFDAPIDPPRDPIGDPAVAV